MKSTLTKLKELDVLQHESVYLEKGYFTTEDAATELGKSINAARTYLHNLVKDGKATTVKATSSVGIKRLWTIL